MLLEQRAAHNSRIPCSVHLRCRGRPSTYSCVSLLLLLAGRIDHRSEGVPWDNLKLIFLDKVRPSRYNPEATEICGSSPPMPDFVRELRA